MKAKIKRARGNERPYETFVRRYMEIYNAGGGLQEIAAAIGTTENTVGVTASRLSADGVRLPKVTDRFDAKYLNRIIQRAKGGAA
jgi:hypothetical protein